MAEAKKAAWIAGGAVVACIVGLGALGNQQDRPNSAAPMSSAAPLTTARVVASPFATAPAVPPAEPTAAQVRPASLAPPTNPDALAKLATLSIKGRAPKTGYDRALFGQAWSDDVTVAGGHNGCDTRNDILQRDLTAITFKPGSNGCAVLTGTLLDPYTGATIAFRRGKDTSDDVQIDHVVALGDAWQKGAQQWDELTRRNFANDPLNLQATDGAANQQKGDSDAASWLPPNKAYRCTYVSRQIDVKAAYGLWVTQAEHDAMARVLSNCAAADAPIAEPQQSAVPVHTTEVAPPVAPLAPAQPQQSSTYYPNCAAARAAGAAPIYAGQPGYSSKLDRDGDGVACE